MGFYLRKSIKAGPFRFNLSKSGIGVSAGIKGLRVGTGPAGNYIQMGRGGLYYRKTLNNTSTPRNYPSNNDLSQQRQQNSFTDPGYSEFKEIKSGDISAMTDSSSAELLAEFDSKRKRIQTFPFAISLFIFVSFVVLTGPLILGSWIVLALFGILAYASHSYDQVKKSVVLFYEMEPEFEQAYKKLHDAFADLQAVNKIWHVESQANVLDHKRNAGADQLLKKSIISLITKDAPYVKTNIAVPSVPTGQKTLFFFPDRILIFDKNKVGAVSYNDLGIQISSTKFIESGSVPKDAQIVGQTWQYVNKSGGPDKRFKNNRQIPMCLYENMHLTSKTGLNELFELSKIGVSNVFKIAVSQIDGVLKEVKTTPLTNK